MGSIAELKSVLFQVTESITVIMVKKFGHTKITRGAPAVSTVLTSRRGLHHDLSSLRCSLSCLTPSLPKFFAANCSVNLSCPSLLAANCLTDPEYPRTFKRDHSAPKVSVSSFGLYCARITFDG